MGTESLISVRSLPYNEYRTTCPGWIRLNHAIKGTRYVRRTYPSYTRTSGKTGNSNGLTLLSRRIIIQAAICILIVFLCIWFQNSEQEFSQSMIDIIRTQVVERNITAEDILQSFTDIYEECVQYLKGTD